MKKKFISLFKVCAEKDSDFEVYVNESFKKENIDFLKKKITYQ